MTPRNLARPEGSAQPVIAATEPKALLAALDREQLIALYGEVMAELRARRIVRSANNPIADIAEQLVADCLGGSIAPPKEKSWDVVAQGRRLLVKALRITGKHSGGLSPLRTHDFDALVVGVFEIDMRVRGALYVPLDAVRELQGWSATWQANRLSVTRRMRAHPRVRTIPGDTLLTPGAEALDV